MDISVYDNYSGVDRDFDFFFLDGKYKVCSSALAIICMRGEATFKVKLYKYTIRRCNFLVIGPNTPFYIKNQSEDFHIDVIRVGNDISEIANESYLKRYLDGLMNERRFNVISERQLRMFHIMHSYLKVLLMENPSRYRDLVVLEYTKIFFYEACYLLDKNFDTNAPKKEWQIAGKFLKLAEEYYKNNRKVEFYADMIGISPKHLAFITKKNTGKYPSEWLEEYALLEAKKMLRNTDESIQTISFDLNFATPSHFSRFFRLKTGMTPKEFRKTNWNDNE